MKKTGLKRAAAALIACTMLPATLAITAFADVSWSSEEWNVSEQDFANPDNFRLGREDARSSFFPFLNEEDALASQQVGKDRDLSKALYQSLDTSAGQKWKFYYVSSPDERKNRPDNDNIMNPDYDDSAWDDITVPKSWEASYNEDGTFKYNAPQYTNTTYPWVSQNPNPQKPHAPTQFNPVGFYRTKLDVDPDFQGRPVFLTFEGVESAFYVWVNGHKVGFSEDSFTSKEFRIDEYLNYDGNDTLAVEVYKWSSGSWLEDQDMIRLAGIFRSVYLTAKDDVDIRDFTIVPKKTGTGTDKNKDYQDFDLDVYASIRDLGAAADQLENLTVGVSLYDQIGKKVGEESFENAALTKTIGAADFTGKDSLGRKTATVKLSARVKNPAKWSAEYPNLYKALITLRDKDGNIIETTAYRFGFRVVEILNKGQANAQMAVNGEPLVLKGVNIHEMSPDTGRYISSETIRKDVTLMKQNNFNAIRMSHYSHDFRYYDVADELGMYVMDEVNLETHGDRSIPGDNPNYLPACLDRLASMFYRSKNFPSVVILSLGNEAGSGSTFANMNAWLKGTYEGRNDFYTDPALKGDLQNRPTHYEGDNDKVDIKGNMYPDPASIPGLASENKPYIVMEYSHAMGNSNGNYQGYWDAFESRDNIQGGFIWDWVDQTITTYTDYRDAPPQISGGTVAVSQDKNKVSTDLTAGESALKQAGVSGAADDHALSGAAVANPTPDALNVNGSLTLEAWVKPQDNSTDPRVILAKGDTQFQLKTVNNSLQFNTYFDTWNELSVNYDASSWAGKWHHVAATYDAATKTACLYLDDMSKPVATKVFTNAQADGTFNKTTHNFAVGRDVENAGSRDWQGLIDNARVYDKALSASELSKENRKADDQNVVFWQEFNVLGSAGSDDVRIVEDGYYGYGGDWGDTPNDGNFCQNGIVTADRQVKGSMLELKRVHQDFVMNLTAFDKTSAKVNIRSRAMFANASDYEFVWQLTEDGKVIREGTQAVDLAPKASKEITLAFDSVTPKQGSEYYLTAKFLLKADTQWAKKGHEISAEQMELDYKTGKLPAQDLSNLGSVSFTEQENSYTVTGKDFTMTFDRQEGAISSFVYKGTELFAQDGVNGPAPNFWRAPNDNDRLSSTFQNNATAWRYAGSNRSGIQTSIEKAGNAAVKITVSGKLAPSKGQADFGMTLTVYGDGQIVVDNTMTPSGFTQNDFMPAIGNLMQLSSQFENMTWYGRGSDDPALPSESYVDRESKQFIGVYDGKVSDQHTEYAKVNDSGNKTDVRWVALTDDSGTGLVASSIGGEFQVNAKHYTPEEYTTLTTKHPYETTPTKNVVLSLNHMQIGVGCDPSWLDKGWQDEADMPRPTKTYSYSYKLSPVSGFTADKAMEFSRQSMDLNPVEDILTDGESLADFDPDKTDYTVYVNGDQVPTVTVKASGDMAECTVKQAENFTDRNTATVTASIYGVTKTYTITFKKYFASQYLDDMDFVKGTSGHDRVHVSESLDGNPITVWVDGKNKVFEHGLAASPESEIVYDIEGLGYNLFTAYVNLDREVYKSSVSCPGMRFAVYVDGVLKYQSADFDKDGYGEPMESDFVSVDVTGAKELKLVMNATFPGQINNSHGDWADAKLSAYADGKRAELFEKLTETDKFDAKDYQAGAWEAFQKAVESLKAIANDPASTQETIEKALVQLETAVEELKKHPAGETPDPDPGESSKPNPGPDGSSNPDPDDSSTPDADVSSDHSSHTGGNQSTPGGRNPITGAVGIAAAGVLLAAAAGAVILLRKRRNNQA